MEEAMLWGLSCILILKLKDYNVLKWQGMRKHTAMIPHALTGKCFVIIFTLKTHNTFTQTELTEIKLCLWTWHDNVRRQRSHYVTKTHTLPVNGTVCVEEN